MDGNLKNEGMSHQVIEKQGGGSSSSVEIASDGLSRQEVRDGKKVIEECMPNLNIRIEAGDIILQWVVRI